MLKTALESPQFKAGKWGEVVAFGAVWYVYLNPLAPRTESQ